MKVFLSFLIGFMAVIMASSDPSDKLSRLIKTSENGPATWMTERDIWSNLIRKHKPFIDFTDHQEILAEKPRARKPRGLPTECSRQNATRNLLGAINADRVESFVTQFSSYYNRYYKAKTGIDSQSWLLSQVQQSLEGYTTTPSTVEEFDHSWPQKSIIARIEGSDPSLKSEVIVLGAHQDSINMLSSRFRAPGADDNAAGSVVVLESLRAIVDSGYVPTRTLEFHWYAAEEVGLRGSAAIAQAYKNKNVDVIGMLNFDVPGYQDKDIKNVGIYVDNSNPELTQFLRILTDEYLEYGHEDCKCGYGCSDHASWTNYGYPAAMPAEVKFHPYMHTTYDNVDNVGFPQIREFIKLSLSAIVEYGESNPPTPDTPDTL